MPKKGAAAKRSSARRTRRPPGILGKTDLLLKLLAHSSDIIALHDLDGRYLFCNAPPAYGLGADDIINHYPKDLFPARWAATRVSQIRKVAKSGRPLRTEQSLVWNGRDLWLSMELFPVMDAEGKVVAVANIARNITERKLAQEHLQKTAAHYKHVLDTAPVMAVTLDPKINILYANDAFLKAVGYEGENLIGKSWIDLFVPEEEREERRTRFDAVFLSPKPRFDMDATILNKNGERRVIAWNGTFEADNRGRTTSVTSLGIDVTEQREAEMALKDRDAPFRGIIELASQGIATISPELKFTYVNRKGSDILGFSPDEMIGRSLETFFLAPDIDQLSHPGRGSANLESSARCKDGRLKWLMISSSPLPVKNNEFGGSVLIMTDITNRKHDEQELKRYQNALEELVREQSQDLLDSAERLRVSFELGPLGMGQTTPDKGFVLVNDRLCEILGYSRDELQTLTWEAFTHPDDLSANVALYRRLLAGEISNYSLEKRCYKKDGKLIHVKVWTKAIRSPAGEILHILGAIDDITDRKELEGKLRQSERLASIGTLAAGVAHQINNPLGIILMIARTALATGDFSDNTRRSFEDIADNAKRGGFIVANVLKFARQGSSEKASSPIDIAIKRAVSTASQSPGQGEARFMLSLSEDSPHVLHNGSDIEQLVVNLLNNAVQAGATSIEVSTRYSSHNVILSVKDNGKGIPQPEMHKIFDPFYTTRLSKGGIGLGLSIVHGIVADHAGTIDVESRPGEGATFTLSLPMETCAASDNGNNDKTRTVK